MQTKKYIVLFLSILYSLTLSACYNSTEVDDMVYILALGMDQTGTSDKIYSFQAAIPLNISGGVKTGFSESEDTATLQNISITASSIFSAIEQVNEKLAKEINLSHCKLLLFSSNLDVQSIRAATKEINQYGKLEPSTFVAMCENRALDYLNSISSPFEKNPARYYEMYFKKNHTYHAPEASLHKLNNYKSIVIPYLTESLPPKAAVIADINKPVILSTNDTMALNMINGNFKKGYLLIDDMPVEILSATTPRVSADVYGSNSTFSIKLSFKGKLYTQKEGTKINEEIVEKYIEDLCLNFLNLTAKELNIGVARLSNYLRVNFITIEDYTNFALENNLMNSKFSVCVEFKTIK